MNYERMYFYLFNKITDIHSQLEEIQLAREEMYINISEASRWEEQKKREKARSAGKSSARRSAAD